MPVWREGGEWRKGGGGGGDACDDMDMSHDMNVMKWGTCDKSHSSTKQAHSKETLLWKGFYMGSCDTSHEVM